MDGNLKCFGRLDVDGHFLSIKGDYTQYYGTRVQHGGTLSVAGDFAASQGNAVIEEGLLDTDDLRADPTAFSGKSVDEVAQALMDIGYNIDISKSEQSKSGAVIIRITNPGNGKNIAQVQVSPGGGRHGEAPYVKFSTTDQGRIKVIDGYERDYKTDGKEKAILIFAKQ